ncbi:MAG TPA: uracil-DNA glycosylase [Nitrospirae bacterium]|nr:uracil-DNA glycosylase [Nitrospirota bacterium]HDZ01362.1 uracil-DNA glycosylase [Nitrospirota bacterium]
MIIKELRKVIEFYGELGFEYLPLKREDIYGLISEKTAITGRDSVCSNQNRAGDEDNYISDKEDALKNLRKEIGDCHRCKLSENRKNIVFGEGNPDAELMFIGEGPGRDEDIQARPFVGNAGKLLAKMILKMGFKQEDVYIANIVKCRPPFNREPGEDEITTCLPYVEKQIEIINPKVIVSLGKIAAQSLLRSKVPISKLRGSFHDFQNIPVMPTFHPAYLLRNPKEKWLTWDDMQKVLEKLKKR